MKTKLFCLGICFAIFFAGCNGKRTRDFDAGKVAADSTNIYSKADTTLNGAKLVKTASINFKVKNVQRSCEDIANLTAAYRGLVMHHAMQATQQRSYDNPLSNDSVMRVISYTATADLTVRVPSNKMEDFMNMVGKMAVYVSTRTMDVQDKTLDYLSSNLKVQSRSEIVEREKGGNITPKNADKVIALSDDMVDEKINYRRIAQDVKYSTVGLTLYQDNTIIKQVVINDDPANFKPPVFKQLGNSIANGWYGFIDVVIALANVWVLFVLCATGWFAYRYYKRSQVLKAA